MNQDLLSLQESEKMELKKYLSEREISDVVYLINRNRFFHNHTPAINKTKHITRLTIKGVNYKNDFVKLTIGLTEKLYYYGMSEDYFNKKELSDNDELMLCLTKPFYHTVNALCNCVGLIPPYIYGVAEVILNKEHWVLRDIIKKYYDALKEEMETPNKSIDKLCSVYYDIETWYLQLVGKILNNLKMDS